MAGKVLSRLDIILFANTAQYRREMRETGESTKTLFQAMRADAANMAKHTATAFASMAAAGTVAVGVLIKEQMELAKEIQNAANIANTSTQTMQKHAYAAKAVGVEMDKLADIYKDVQDKVGDFLSTGGGELMDFFENVAPQAGVTAEQFRKLSGPDALQLFYNTLDRANLSQAEMTFYLEGIASDAAVLIPLLADGGEGFRLWAEAAENAGAIMDAETIRATNELNTSVGLLKLSLDGAKNQIVKEMLPTVSDMAAAFVTDANAKELARVTGQLLAKGLKLLAKAGVTTITVFEGLGIIVNTVARSFSELFDGISLSDNTIMLALKMAGNFKDVGRVISEGDAEFARINRHMAALNFQIDSFGDRGTVNPVVRTLTDITTTANGTTKALGLTGAQIAANREEQEKAAKEAKKIKADAAARYTPKAINAAVLAQAQKYNYAETERRYGLPQGLLAAVSMQESRGNPNAKSPDGAKGLFQFMPKTAERFKIKGREFDPVAASDAAARYLKTLIQMFGNVELALAGYNAGEGNVQKYGNKIPPFKETRDYVPGVMRYLAFMQGREITAGSSQIAVGDMIAEQAKAEAEAQERRYKIQLEFADKRVQMEAERDKKIQDIREAGFDEAEEKRLTDLVTQQYDEELKAFDETQKKKIEAITEYATTEADLITRNAKYKMDEIARDRDMTAEQRKEAIIAVAEAAKYELHVNDLKIAREMQAANEWQQTREEQIRNTYDLERREILLTLGVEDELKNARLASIDALERRELAELAATFKAEIDDVTAYGLSALEQITTEFERKREELDRRTDLSDAQRVALLDALRGAEQYAVAQHKNETVNAFNSLSAELDGTADAYGLAETYRSRLDIVEQYEKEHTDKVLEAEKMRNKIRMDFEIAATRLSMSQAEGMVGNMADAFKTMLGESSRSYKALFAIQQSFVMASAGINMYKAWGDAMAEGATMAQKLTAAATIATEFGRIISAAKAITLDLPGYKDGGYTGNGRTDEPAGIVHGKEFVANASATRKYRRELEDMNAGKYDGSAKTAVNVSVTVNGNGSASVESSQRAGRELGNTIAAVVKQQLIKEKRQGGLLYG